MELHGHKGNRLTSGILTEGVGSLLHGAWFERMAASPISRRDGLATQGDST